MITGDLNAQPHELPNFQRLLEEGWTDLGANAHIYNKPQNEYTCITTATKTPSRIDYILVSPALLPYITDFEVLHDQYPAHSTLQIKITIPTTIKPQRTLIKPGSLHELLQQHHDANHDTDEHNTTWKQHLRNFQDELDTAITRAQPQFDNHIQSTQRIQRTQTNQQTERAPTHASSTVLPPPTPTTPTQTNLQSTQHTNRTTTVTHKRPPQQANPG
jgi:hypothetical protein